MNYENKYEGTFDTLKKMLNDVVGFIKSFVKTLTAFIDGFKTNYSVEEPKAE